MKNGFVNYIIKQNDTIYKLANEYGTTVNRIMIANPNLNIHNLMIGMQIIIPVGEIVQINRQYNFNILKKDVNNLKLIYSFLEIGEIGKSVLGNEIIYIKVGNGTKKLFYNGSFHANEWITTPVLMKFIEEYSKAIVDNNNIYGYNARLLFENISLYIVPMVNPDGVDLVTGSIKNVDKAYKEAEKIANRFPSIPFPSGWKANINGVDLNLQFPAEWERAKNIKYAQGFNQPSPRDFVGYGPLTEPESLAIYNFTLKNDFKLVISYHTQGEEIYWKFLNYNPPMSEYIGKQFAAASGYLLTDVPYNSSFAGYKDWFIQEYNKPGYTIEAGLGKNPLPISQFNSIYEKNKGILVLGMINI